MKSKRIADAVSQLPPCHWITRWGETEEIRRATRQIRGAFARAKKVAK